MSKVLVTGGAGFIGSHLVDKLLAEGHDVIVVDDMSGGTRENLKNANLAPYASVDCRDARLMDLIMMNHKPEIVYHLAANAAENKAQFSPIDITSRNYDAFIKVLTPFIKYGGKRFVFTSSIAVYGALQTPFRETDKPEPEDLYGISKLAIEQSLKVMSDVHGFEYVIARPHNVFGERQNMTDPYRNVVTIWMNAILRNQPLYVYGEGKQIRQFTYIDEITQQLYACGTLKEAKNKIFNIGNSNPITVLEMLDMIKKVTGNMSDPVFLPMRPQEVMSAVANHDESDKYLGFRSVSRIKALELTWAWCKARGPQEPVYTELEIKSDKVPSNWIK